MAEAELYIDCDRAKSVIGELDNTIKDLPRFVEGDSIKLRIYLLKGFDRTSEYTNIPTDGLTLQVALGARDGSEIYASQYVWTESDDLSDPYFEALLPMNTEELADALTGETYIPALFEVKYVQDGVPTTVLQENVTVFQSLIDPDSVMPVATPTPLSAEAAGVTYVKKTHRGPIYLEAADGSHQVKLWVDTDGTFRATPVF